MSNSAKVVIAEYRNEWPIMFGVERLRLASLFPACVIEHIGSTAVPGLAAKPIIDLMLGVDSLSEIERHIESLSILGYEYFPQYERFLPQRRYFARTDSGDLGWHLHAVVKDTPFWSEHLAFRNALRGDARLAGQYASLKRQLAEEFGNDREAYTDAKAPFIRSVLTSPLGFAKRS